MFSFLRSNDDLKPIFLAAARGGDEARLRKLCRQHHQAAWKAWPGWASELIALQADPQQARALATDLRRVAQAFQDELGDGRFLQMFGTPTPEQRLQDARDRVRQLDLTGARALLVELQQELASDHGLRVFVLGDLAQLHFFERDFEGASCFLKECLQCCEQQRDQQGLHTYAESYYELLRYQDRRQEAADWASLQGWRERADRVCREPLLRVVLHVDDAVHELDQLPTRREAQVSASFRRNRITLYPARVLAQRGRELAAQGQSKAAEEELQRACVADSYDPEPHMLLGLIALDEGRFAQAVAHLEASEQRAPGYFHVRSNLWFAGQLKSRRLEPRDWAVWRQLEDGGMPPQDRLSLARQWATHRPLPHGLFHQARALQELGQGEASRELFEQALKRQPEPHLRTRILLQIGGFSGQPERLRQAVEVGGCLVSAAMARWLLQSF